MGSPSEAVKHSFNVEVATRMFEDGESVDFVQRYIHLDIEELEEIRSRATQRSESTPATSSHTNS